MYDFPGSPTLNQTFTPVGGPSWVWNGTGWIVTGGLPSIPEAPVTGLQYARKNANWEEVVVQQYGNLFNYMFNASTVIPPAAGSVRMDNANQALATTLWINYTTNDSVAVNLKTYFQNRLKIGDTLYLQDKDDITKWRLYKVSAAWTDAGTYATVPVSYQAGGSALTAARIIVSREGAGVDNPVGEAPTDGLKYARRSSNWVSIPNITVASTAPSSPAVNDVWIDTT